MREERERERGVEFDALYIYMCMNIKQSQGIF